MLVFLFNATAHTADSGKQTLEEIIKATRPMSVPLKSLPQNFGGGGLKLRNDETDKLAKKAKEITISDEAVFQDVVQDVMNPLQKMIEQKAKIFSRISENGAKFIFKSIKKNAVHEFDGIHQYKWVSETQESSAKEFEEKFFKYLEAYSQIEYASVSPFSMSTSISDRASKTAQPIAFKTLVRFDVRGAAVDKTRRNDRFIAEIFLKKSTNASRWTISHFALQEGETLTTKNKFFEEVNAFSKNGLPSNYVRKEAIRRGGYALSLGDWNNDGISDLIVGHLGKIEFFEGQKNLTFKKIENGELGIEDETLVKSAVVNDFDNDGLKDLLIVRFAPSEQAGKDVITYKGTLTTNKGLKFRRLTSIKNRYPAYYAMPSAVADFNNDGLLDFYIGFPGAKDFTVLNKDADSYAGMKETQPQGLFYNVGNLSFQEVTKEKLPYTKSHNAYTDGYPEAAVVFPHTSTAVDYNLDGHMDIVVVDDKANLSPLYKNTAGGVFAQTADLIGTINSDFGMGFAAVDLDNDGKLEFIYSNVNFLAAERMKRSLASNFTVYDSVAGTNGIKIFKTLDGKHYSDITALTGIIDVGEGVAGVEAIDYNNDGLMDLYVTNGLWSGTSREQDLSSQFARAYLNFRYDYQEVMNSPHGIEEANTTFMKILTGFEGNVENAKTQPGIYPSMAGFQRNRLFRNNGDGTFTEIGYLAGVDSMSDGYVAATADLSGDGKMDLVLRNCDPGAEKNMFPAVQIYKNNFSKNKSVVLSFQGSKSNRDGIGVIAVAKIGNKKIVRHLVANNGSVQNQSILHFGLGNSEKIDSLRIQWPSGEVDILHSLPPGHHLIKEKTTGLKAASL